MPFISTFRARAGKGKGIGGGTSLILPRVGPFANAATQVVSTLSDITYNGVDVSPTTTPATPDIYKTVTVTSTAGIDITTKGGYYLWCDKFVMLGSLTYGFLNPTFPDPSGGSGTLAGKGGGGIFGGGSGAGANTTVGTYLGGTPGNIKGVNGSQGQVADGYTTGAGGTGVAISNYLPSNYYYSILPKSGKGGDVTIGAFTSGVGGGGSGTPGIVCVVCNKFQYDRLISYFALIPAEGGFGGLGCGNGGDSADTGLMVIMTKNKITKGGDLGPPNYNFDTSITSGGPGGIHGQAGKNGALGRFEFWEIKRDNTLVYHWNPKDVWNNL